MCPSSRTTDNGASGGAPLWPVAVAVGARLAAWALIPATGFASDEESYFQVATRLLTTGDPDLFWPPFTGWLIATVRFFLRTDYLPVIRLVWIAMDIGCVLAVRVLAMRVAERMAGGPSSATRRAATAMTLGYALYLPAISHAQFLTSETPALLQLLLALVLITGASASALSFLAGGGLIGTLVMTRPSLLPLLVTLPLAVVTAGRNPRLMRRVLLFLIAGTLLVSGLLVRNWLRAGEMTLARNSAYNLYIGNRDMYGEDLNLLRPRATAAQIEFRRQMWDGTPSVSAGISAGVAAPGHRLDSAPSRNLCSSLGRTTGPRLRAQD